LRDASFACLLLRPPRSPLLPYTTLFRSSGVEPQLRSPKQPFSRFHTLAFPDLTEADMWGMSPVDQMVCRIQFRRAAYQGIYTPPDRKSTRLNSSHVKISYAVFCLKKRHL